MYKTTFKYLNNVNILQIKITCFNCSEISIILLADTISSCPKSKKITLNCFSFNISVIWPLLNEPSIDRTP